MSGGMALLRAAQTDDVAAVAGALAAGELVDGQDRHGNTVLWWVSAHGQSEVVSLLLAHRANVNLANELGVTPLLMACGGGKTENTEQLLAALTCDVNMANWEGTTPLHAACENGHAHIVDMLLQQPGLNRDAKDNAGKTALQWAQNRGNLDIVRQLEADAAGDTVTLRSIMFEVELRAAAQRGDVTQVAHQLDRGTPIDSQDSTGQTALFYASARGQVAVVDLLVSRRANVNLGHKYGWTPLLIAAINARAEATSRLLMASDIDVNQPSHNGGGPLPVASMSGHSPIVELLLKHPTIDRSAEHKGKNALQWAQQNGHAAIVKLLEE